MRPMPSLPVTCGQIRLTDQTLMETDGGTPLIMIPRREITGIRFRHGFVSPHPVLQFVFGAALLSLGVLPTVHILYWLRHGGPFFSHEVWFYSLAFIGLYTAFTAFRRDHVLDVTHAGRRTRVAFGRRTTPTGINQFFPVLEVQLAIRIEQG